MAFVRTFRIVPDVGFGVPDNEITSWINKCEKECRGIVNVTTTFVPAMGAADPRLTIIVTKLDDAD